MTIDWETQQDTSKEPKVDEGKGWRRVTPVHGARWYEDCAPADDRWEETDIKFTSVTECLRAGVPTDFTGPTKWSQARWTWEHRADLFSKPQDEMIRLMVESSGVTLQQAADRGSAGHRYIEARLGGNIPDFDDTDRNQAGPWLAGMEQFLSDVQPETVMLESVCFDRTNQVAGTFDALVRWPEHGVVLVDWKGLAVETPLPTPTGWTTMGEVQVGDYLIGADGRPCKVVGKSEVRERPCYRISFDDKTSIVCDDEHLWQVLDVRTGVEKVIDTATLAESQAHKNRPRYAIPNTQPIGLPDADLLVDPYILGIWLGDGCIRRGEICKPDDRLWAEVRALGYKHTPRETGENKACTIYGLVPQLREIGVLDDKHVPTCYMRASRAQRLSLLQGLLDTDGQWNPVRGQAVFSNTNERLARSVYELVVSLGWRANLWDHIAHGFGVSVREWRVAFTPFGVCPFRSRRDEVDLPDRTRSKRRVIQSVEEVPSVPTQCVMVDSHDSLYLCGEQMVPTHNTRASKHDRRPKEAIQLGAYMTMLTEHYFMDHRGQRRQLDNIDGAVIVTFAPDGTWAPQWVDVGAAKAAYETALAMRLANRTSHLYGGNVKPSAPFDPNETLLEAIGHVPEGTPEHRQLSNVWVTSGLGAPSKGQVPPERYGEAMALIYRYASKYQPFPVVDEKPLCISQADQNELVIRLRHLPLDIRQQVLHHGTGLSALDGATCTVADAEDWDRHIARGEKAAILRWAAVSDLLKLLAGAGIGASTAILRPLPDPQGWTERDFTIAAACWKALDEDRIGLFGDELCVNVADADALTKDTEGGKRALIKLAKEKATELGLTKPSKWDDLMADPILYAAVVAA